jgi:hypothetical protein
MGIHNRCAYILMASDPHVSDDEIIAGLPSVDEIIATQITNVGGELMHATHGHVNSFVSCAAVCDKMERYSEAMIYTSAGMVKDFKQAGTTAITSRVLLQTIQGRALAALGRQGEAAAVFEAAYQEAHRYGLWLYAAFALRDLKVCVLDGMGHGEHGSRRLGAALRLLTGPPELLTPLLGGLDAPELMALGPPEAGYQVAFATSPSHEPAQDTALRQELSALRVMKLHARALADGVDSVAVDDAMDSYDPKAELIALLLDAA